MTVLRSSGRYSVFKDSYDDPDYSEPESDDSGIGPGPVDSESEPEEEEDITDHWQSSRTQPQLPSGQRAQKIYSVLLYMGSQGITLADLLDGISWGDEECTQNAQIRVHRTQLLQSAVLPGILRRWWRPPRPRGSHRKRPQGARAAMQNFALECSQQILHEQIENLAGIFKSPAGEDIKEEHLTAISIPKMDLRVVVLAMFSYSRPHHRCRLQKLFAIYFKFRGLSAKGFDTLHAMGLTMSNKWTGDAVGRISSAAMAAVRRLMDLFPWLLSSGCTVYVRRTLQEMRAQGMANPLNAFDIFEISEIADSRRYPHIIHLFLRYLLDAPDFDFLTYDGCDSTLLERPPFIHQLPFGKEHITLQYLLASYEDNSKLINEWLRQLSLDSPEKQKKIGLEQVMVWVDWLVTPPGWLHIQMAFANSIHKQHIGTPRGRGLSAAFDVLKRHYDLKSQSIMFLRDVVPFILLRAAVRHGDVGFMEDMIPLLLYRFVGGKNSLYAIEMLELLQAFNREWPAELWLLTAPKDLKLTGSTSKKLHPAIHVIRAVNAHMETEFKTRVRGTKHTVPKKELDIQALQQWYRASEVHKLQPGRVVYRNPNKPNKGSSGVQLGSTLENWHENRSIERSTTQNWDDTPASDSDEYSSSS
ncbi:hypothetical protein R3P38DRAFT_3321536 [Favolaschia claudopus]|uniref:DUF6589 domain-containing protein n=1 Tax=Favolaschia claudopus TaxID=2862362 RepID=A0AAW0ATF9_9AGAR